MAVTVPITFATLPAGITSAADLDLNFAALVNAINANALGTGQVVNAQTGVSYAVVAGDLGKLLTLTNAGAIAVTLPQAIGAFAAPFFADVATLSTSVGAVTITPTVSTINGASTLVVEPGKTVRIVSDGANYQLGVNAVNGTMTLGTENVMNPYATSSASTVAHLLPRIPDYCFLWLQNLTTELGYAAGDRVPILEGGLQGTNAADINVSYNATNTIIAAANTLVSLVNRSTFAVTGITAARWKIVAQPVIVNGGIFV